MKRMRNSRQEQGQAAVLVALSLFTMVVFLAMATNTGILVNDRIRMQNAADLAAYAGAFEQARALNRLTQINKRIYRNAYNLRSALTCPGIPELDTGDQAIIENFLEGEPLPCKKIGILDPRVFPCEPKIRGDYIPVLFKEIGAAKIDALAAAFKITNLRSKDGPLRAARFTANANIEGLARPTKSSFYEWQIQSPTFRGKPMMEVEQVKTRFDYAVFKLPFQCGNGGFFPRIKIETYNFELDTWFTKANPGPTVFFPTRVNGVPMKDFLDVPNPRGGYFGADAERGVLASDELTAFAVAKPYGGNLGPSDGHGDRKTVTFRVLFKSESVGNAVDYNSFGEPELTDSDTGGAFIEKYRARMAGLQDRMLKDEEGSVDDRAFRPIQLMMVDMVRATKAPAPLIERFTAH